MKKDLSKQEIFQVVTISIMLIWTLVASYDIYLNRELTKRNKQYALDWSTNEEAILAGVTASLDNKLVNENPFLNGDDLYQRNHDLWERGWFTVFIHREDKARKSN